MAKAKGSKSTKQDNTRGKGAKDAAIKLALKRIESSHEMFFAIEEVGEWLPGVKEVDTIATCNMVGALCDKARDCYALAMNEIAHLKHPATQYLLKACDALDYLETILKMARMDSHPDRLERRALSRAILTFVGECARWMEQAEESLGTEYGFGWLNELEHVYGVPDGEFSRLDPQQKWIAHQFGRLNPNLRERVADFVNSAVAAQEQR
jgi:hypothetical protein